MEKTDQLKEIEDRIHNFQVIIQIAEFELLLLLEQKKELETRRPVGFRTNPKDNEKTKGARPTS